MQNWKKRVLSVILALCAVAGLLPTALALAADTEADCTHEGFTNGICDACGCYEPAVLNDEGVYEISKAGQLLWFAEFVNSTPAELLVDRAVQVDAKLTADIDMTGLPWIPIGQYAKEGIFIISNGFGGTFDGYGHTVSGIDCTVTTTGDSSAMDSPSAGFFGNVYNATIRNLMVEGSFTAVYAGTSNNPTACAGGIVAFADGGNPGSDSAYTVIENCGFVGTLSAEGYNMTQVGGIAGYCYAALKNCWSAATVESSGATYQYLGGLVGINSNCTYENCYYDSTLCALSASFQGDLTGVTGKTTAQFASGEVAYLLQGEQTGQVWGQTIGAEDYPVLGGKRVYQTATCQSETAYSNTEGEVIHAYKNGICSDCGDVCGHSESTHTTATDNGDGKHSYICTVCGAVAAEDHTTTAQATCSSKAVCAVCGDYGEADLTNHNETVSYNENGFCPNGCYEPAVLNNGVYEIGNAGQLYWFAALVNGGETSANAVLTADITVPASVSQGGSIPDWTPMGWYDSTTWTAYSYTGTFDGSNFTISNLYITDVSTDRTGMFGEIGEAGIVRNMSLTNLSVAISCEVANLFGDIGTIVGYNRGRILDCAVDGTISIDVTATTGSANPNVGGIAGLNQDTGSIENCSFTGSINFSAVVAGHADPDLGGIVGLNYGTVRNCYSICDTISSGYNVGGITGFNGNDARIESCYSICDTLSGSDDVGGIAGWNAKRGIIKNTYFLCDESIPGIGSESSNSSNNQATAATSAQFASGEVAYLLQKDQDVQIWGQNIDNGGENEGRPVFSDAKVYYGYTTCHDAQTDAIYTNTETSDEKPGHSWKGTGCENCDATRENPFVDVPEDSFYFDPVLWAVEKGITTGTDATHFAPNGECMRAAVVTFLWRAAGSPEPTSTDNPFTDVSASDFYYKAVLWAVEKGITNGISATEFGPFALCNRAQVVTFLWRAQSEPASNADIGFTDVEDGQFYTAAVAWAVENGITNGISETEFGINTICNRAQVVTFLYRTLAK